MPYLNYQWEILVDYLKHEYGAKERDGWLYRCEKIVFVQAEDGHRYAWKLTKKNIKLELAD